MIGILIGLAFLCGMLWLGFKVTGALFAACFWLFIEVPLSLAMWAIGLACCCTLILIPVGLWLFKNGFKLLVPGI